MERAIPRTVKEGAVLHVDPDWSADAVGAAGSTTRRLPAAGSTTRRLPAAGSTARRPRSAAELPRSTARGRVLLRVAAAAAVLPLGVLPALSSALPGAGALGAGRGTAVPRGAGDTPSGAAPGRQVVVTALVPGVDPVAAVRAAGGVVLDRLPLISGVVAALPAGRALPAGVLLADDRPVRVAGRGGPDKQDAHGRRTNDNMAPGQSAGEPAQPPPETLRTTVGLATTGTEGSGITIALVDTGVADVPDLAGRIVAHVDAGPGGTRLRDRGADGFGHGTFLAGLLAGGASSSGRYAGIAPGARVLDVDVAGDDGSTSLTAVLRGLQVVADRARTDRIRVVNLALSTDSPLPAGFDPLTLALEALWRHDIAVVVPAGNDGPAAGTLSSPGIDPLLLTVGALDEQGSAGRADDTVTSWSARGPAGTGPRSAPDLVAPGAHLLGPAAPGSAAVRDHPEALVDGAYLRGSGTSMATAVTSGAAAALLARRPGLRPDDVKRLLVDTAYSDAELSDPAAAGAGGLDVGAALRQVDGVRPGPRDRNRYDDVPGQDPTWAALAAALAEGQRADAAAAWRALGPQAEAWAAAAWEQLDPTTREWVREAWAGRSWAGVDGTAQEWVVRAFAAQLWAGRSWAGRSGADESWADGSWAGRSWAGRSWAGRSWAGRSWAGRSWAAWAWPEGPNR